MAGASPSGTCLDSLWQAEPGHPQPQPQWEGYLVPRLLGVGGAVRIPLGGRSVWSGVGTEPGLSSLGGFPRALHTLSSGWGLFSEEGLRPFF